jgi:hypothetical protein
MKNRNAIENRAARRSRVIALAIGLALTASLAHPTRADDVTPPPVPAEIRVPPRTKAFLEGHAVGTQNYICLPSGAGFAWTLFTPEATLFRDDRSQVTTHFFSPNPFENGAIRVTWQHSQDTSTVWASLVRSSSDPKFVASGAIPWLLLRTAGVQDGPGGTTLTKTAYVQRVNTAGGVAPSAGCSSPSDIGARAFVPYRADYIFYLDLDAR